MMSANLPALFFAAILALLCAGCTNMNQMMKEPAEVNALQVISAGHTGCMPAENVISDSHWGV